MMPILCYLKRNTVEGATSIITYDTDWQAYLQWKNESRATYVF